MFSTAELKTTVQIVKIIHDSSVTIHKKQRSIVKIWSIHSLSLSDVLKSIVHIVKIVHGSPVTIQARKTNVILHIPEKVYGIILGNIYTNRRTYRHPLAEGDCIISPICEFELHSYDGDPVSEWYTIQVPHIVKIKTIKSKIMVKHRDKYTETYGYALRLLPGQEPPPNDKVNVYYRLGEEKIEIITRHFSQFVIYAENTTLQAVMGLNALQCCTNAVELLVFGKLIQPFRINVLRISVVACNLHYRIESKQVTLQQLYYRNNNNQSTSHITSNLTNLLPKI